MAQGAVNKRELSGYNSKLQGIGDALSRLESESADATEALDNAQKKFQESKVELYKELMNSEKILIASQEWSKLSTKQDEENEDM